MGLDINSSSVNYTVSILRLRYPRAWTVVWEFTFTLWSAPVIWNNGSHSVLLFTTSHVSHAASMTAAACRGVSMAKLHYSCVTVQCTSRDLSPQVASWQPCEHRIEAQLPFRIPRMALARSAESLPASLGYRTSPGYNGAAATQAQGMTGHGTIWKPAPDCRVVCWVGGLNHNQPRLWRLRF
jgi:hypothetical protein